MTNGHAVHLSSPEIFRDAFAHARQFLRQHVHRERGGGIRRRTGGTAAPSFGLEAVNLTDGEVSPEILDV